jgi:hypothetical protein
MQATRDVPWSQVLMAGVAGALALTAVHEGVRRLRHDAPRMDVVGGRAIRRAARAAGATPPSGRRLYALTLAGDVVSNALYYAAALAFARRSPWPVGGAAGVLAGLGGLLLPRRLGLGRPPRSRRFATQVMTVAWYLLGGLVSAATLTASRPPRRRWAWMRR